MSIKIKTNTQSQEMRDFVKNLSSLPTQNLGEIIYDARNKIYKNKIGNDEITIKSFRRPSIINRIAYTFFRKSKARRSFENGIRLQELGVGTPTPIAYIEEYKGGLIDRSFYICSMLNDTDDLRWWDKKDNQQEVLEHTAEFIAQLHQKKIFHKDFSPGNILFDKDWNFYLIDINRMEFDVDDYAKLMDNFRSLHDEPTETERIARLYSYHIHNHSEEEIVALALNARKKYKDHQARKRKFKSIFKHK